MAREAIAGISGRAGSPTGRRDLRERNCLDLRGQGGNGDDQIGTLARLGGVFRQPRTLVSLVKIPCSQRHRSILHSQPDAVCVLTDVSTNFVVLGSRFDAHVPNFDNYGEYVMNERRFTARSLPWLPLAGLMDGIPMPSRHAFPPHRIVLMENMMNAAPHRRTREYEREHENKAERKHCDKALDKSLEDTFPASDP